MAKFKVGDKVKVNGKDGEITECIGGYCSVRLKGWTPKKTVNAHGNEVTTHVCPEGSGKERDHEHDVIGGVHEDDIEAEKKTVTYHGRGQADD